MDCSTAAGTIEHFCNQIDKVADTLTPALLSAALATFIHVKCKEKEIDIPSFLTHLQSMVQQLGEAEMGVRH